MKLWTLLVVILTIFLIVSEVEGRRRRHKNKKNKDKNFRTVDASRLFHKKDDEVYVCTFTYTLTHEVFYDKTMDNVTNHPEILDSIGANTTVEQLQKLLTDMNKKVKMQLDNGIGNQFNFPQMKFTELIRLFQKELDYPENVTDDDISTAIDQFLSTVVTHSPSMIELCQTLINADAPINSTNQCQQVLRRMWFTGIDPNLIKDDINEAHQNHKDLRTLFEFVFMGYKDNTCDVICIPQNWCGFKSFMGATDVLKTNQGISNSAVRKISIAMSQCGIANQIAMTLEPADQMALYTKAVVAAGGSETVELKLNEEDLKFNIKYKWEGDVPIPVWIQVSSLDTTVADLS